MKFQFSRVRLRHAAVAAAWHFLGSFVVAALAAVLVFKFWYPFPYSELSGGRELFFLIILVDVVVGPLLTFVVFDTDKKRAELLRDLCFIVFLQISALSYGLWTVWQARPLLLVAEIDRFKVISKASLDPIVFSKIPNDLLPGLFSGPVTVGIRDPVSEDERKIVLFESALGGRDYAERPEFFLPYDTQTALKSLKRAKPLTAFLERHPDQITAAQKLTANNKADIAQWMYVPVIARQDWIALLNAQGQIQGFLKGDGF